MRLFMRRKWGAYGGRLVCSICHQRFMTRQCPHSWPELQQRIYEDNQRYEEERIRAIVRDEIAPTS